MGSTLAREVCRDDRSEKKPASTPVSLPLGPLDPQQPDRAVCSPPVHHSLASLRSNNKFGALDSLSTWVGTEKIGSPPSDSQRGQRLRSYHILDRASGIVAVVPKLDDPDSTSSIKQRRANSRTF